jgi:hypothetical protein
MSLNRSPKCRQEPLPRVPKVPPKRPYDYTEEENEKIAKEQYMKSNFGKKKPQPEPEPPIPKEKLMKKLKYLHQPEPSLSSNYDRSIRKSNESAKERSRRSKAKGKPVPQLGDQKNSCPPLQVYANVVDCLDLTLVALYKDEADAFGMSIPEYLSRVEMPTGDVQLAYKYQYGQPLVRPEELPYLSTQLRKLHKWYLDACQDNQNWIMLAIKDEPLRTWK